MPLTRFQRRLLAVLARTRTPDSYLAGGAAIHFAPNSTRYSNDLDFFNDSAERVASAFAQDSALLEDEGCEVEVQMSQPGIVRAIVRKGAEATRVDWAHDSAWRFMPTVKDELGGYLLHEVDLAINKVLTLAGRDEPRDYVDALYLHERVLPLGALVWAAVGKDPGFTPLSLLEFLKRRGRVRPEDVARLDLAAPFDIQEAQRVWLAALEEAEAFVRSRPPDEAGCLYYATGSDSFVAPRPDDDIGGLGVVVHYGEPGGVLPRVVDTETAR